MHITSNDSGRTTMPPEWAVQDAVLLSWPHQATDWAYMLDEVKQCFIEIAKAITANERLLVVSPDTAAVEKELAEAGVDLGRVTMFGIPTNDTWARDFGPITVTRNGSPVLLDFKFNAWGLKFAADKDNLINSRLELCEAFACALENHNGFVLEGGSVESDGQGVVMTTSSCLMSKNRNGDLDKQGIEQQLRTLLGAEKVLWLDHGNLVGDDTDGHIDTIARFAPDDIILYAGCDDATDKQYADLKSMEAQLRTFTNVHGKPYNLIELPTPRPIYDNDGLRLPATYANFLITNNSVLVPIYGQKATDDLALKIIKVAFPQKRIVGIDCNALIKQHGSLHCVTMQLPQGTVNTL